MGGRSVPFMAWKVFQPDMKKTTFVKLAQTISFKTSLHFHFEGLYLQAALSFLFF